MKCNSKSIIFEFVTFR